MNRKRIHTGYLIAISLLISSIIYFFASNWYVFERTEKIFLAAILMVSFFLFSFVLSRFQHSHRFLERWLWVAGAIAFGISVAVIGQTYNSHADSYLLYLVWLLPVLAFAILARYQPLFVLAFLLTVAAYFFFVFPTSYDPGWTEFQEFGFLVLFLSFCHLWFFLSRSKYLQSKWIEYGSFGIMHVLFLTQSFGYSSYSQVIAWMYIGYILTSLYLWKKAENRVWLIVSGLGLSLFLFFKGISEVYEVIGSGLYFIFLALIVVIIVLTITYLKRLELSKVSDTWKQRMKSSITAVVTVFCTLMLISAFTGLLALSTSSFLAVFLSAIGLLLLPSLFVKPHLALLSHILLLAGISIVFGSGFIHHISNAFSNDEARIPYYSLVTIILIIVLLKIWHHRWIEMYLYFLLNGSILVSFIVFSEDRGVTRLEFDHYFFLMVLVNMGFFFAIKREWIRYNALVYSITLLFALTFTNEGEWIYWFYNSLFLLVVFTMVFFKTKRHLFSYWLGIVFLYAFLLYKYYDFVWTLLHKSITLLIASLLVFGITWFVSKQYKSSGDVTPSFVKIKMKPLLLIVVMMAAFLTYQGVQSEWTVRNGTEIKLKLAPIDPRSMLQGDYVRLSYDISNLDNASTERQEKINVVLRKNNEGYFEYSGFYKVNGEWNNSYKPASSDVLINGVLSGDGSVQYGIETFFIPEGTGNDYETMNYAFVRVGSNGNAILTELVE
ncbi:GDYXXLXY domain-containing protein [Guptibacillus algicola]|uniref:GDYXXLXY domain-containing protein n=1 Tax=Guptibacillus algicola TaxID=225844 RepID=UPI001CD1C5F3|nr:GDYXXLXY domain-containing protein [Alkalihalobacillus algicola]MCA0988362.1 GDYXXLXY domain-containing protein [Alkalihalobacillus algicola]